MYNGFGEGIFFFLPQLPPNISYLKISLKLPNKNNLLSFTELVLKSNTHFRNKFEKCKWQKISKTWCLTINIALEVYHNKIKLFNSNCPVYSNPLDRLAKKDWNKNNEKQSFEMEMWHQKILVSNIFFRKFMRYNWRFAFYYIIKNVCYKP